jgi:hypothetical protein
MDVGVTTLSVYEYRQDREAEYTTVHSAYKTFCMALGLFLECGGNR